MEVNGSHVSRKRRRLRNVFNIPLLFESMLQGLLLDTTIPQEALTGLQPYQAQPSKGMHFLCCVRSGDSLLSVITTALCRDLDSQNKDHLL